MPCGVGFQAVLIAGLICLSSASNPWDKYNLSPVIRTLHPTNVHQGSGLAGKGLGLFPLTLKGAGAYVVLDFGKEVGGFTTLSFGSTSDASQSVGLAYSESTNYATCPSLSVGACQDGHGQAGAGDHSNGGSGPDGTLSTGSIASQSNYTPAVEHMRGGFRYLNLFLETSGSVEVTGVSLHFTAAPTMDVPAAYVNHFYSSDDLLNRIWYACAYTVQMCTIDPKHGRQWGPPAHGWNNGVTIGTGDSLVVDGAKRDRTIWPGDMGVSTLVAYATTGDTSSSRNSLVTLYALQHPSGQLPYVGPEVFCQKPWGDDCGGKGAWASDTYHLWALIGTINYVEQTADHTWLSSIWSKFKGGVGASLKKVGHKGLMVVDATADWQRHDQGGENIAANALLVHVLGGGVRLAEMAGDNATASQYAAAGAALRSAINQHLWDDKKGAYRDNPTSSLYPQDGNSLAVWFNITQPSQATRVSDYLQSNWAPLGSVSPEWVYEGHAAIGTFPGSMEVHAHVAAGHADRSVELIKRQWGYMLNCPNSTQSTFWEGYQANGQYAFQGIYMSHAHGWAAGPASALSSQVLGLRPHANGNASLLFAPQPPRSLQFCSGSRSLGAGRAVASWERVSSGLRMEIEFSVSSVHVHVPLLGHSAESVVMMVNGVAWWSSSGKHDDGGSDVVLESATNILKFEVFAKTGTRVIIELLPTQQSDTRH